MISRLNRLRNFGIYRNFSGNAASGLPKFNKFNLIYGWNYSGKTTLSRAFSVLENGQMPGEHVSAMIEFEKEDGAVIGPGDFSGAPPVRVFNRTYVEDNFSEEHTASAVFIIGAESAALRARLGRLEGHREHVERIRRELSGSKHRLSAALDKLYTDNARTVGQVLLRPRDFRAPDLKRQVGQVRDNADDYVLTEEELEAALSTWGTSSDDVLEIALIKVVVPSLTQLFTDIDALLKRTASNDALQELKENYRLEDWVRQGRAIHDDRDKCGFCGSDYTENRKAVLGAHFSKVYEQLLNDLDVKIAELKSLQLEIKTPHSKDLMPEVRDSIAELDRNYGEWVKWAQTGLDQFVAELEKKKIKIETAVQSEVDCERADEGQTLVDAINVQIEQNNKLVLNIGQTKQDARQKIEKHYAAKCFMEEDVQAKEDEIKRLTSRVNRTGEVATKIQEKIREIKEKISKAAIGAKNLNKLLGYLLSGSNIEVQSVGEAEFKFLRGENPASNLSEGEKTAVTLAYFLTSLEAEGESLEDTIVFIDDPICSLDSNHIYAVYALIAERLEKCKQLFVSTHNAEFFNLLKGRWLGSKGGNKPDSAAFYVRRIVKVDGVVTAEIADLPILLRKFKSEYEFVFWHLKSFSDSETPSQHEAYTAPNLLRKFLEAYLGFRRPSERVWHKKLDLLFDEPEKQREIQKFSDDASHLQSLDRTLQEPAFVETAQARVREVIAALEVKDNEHYQSLVEVVSEA